MHRLASFTFLEAVGRRLWHNYCWIFFIQVTSYVGKLLIHPTPISSVDEFFARATIGPVPGNVLAANECPRLIAEPDWRLKCAKPAPLDIRPILDPDNFGSTNLLKSLARPTGIEPVLPP